MYKNFMILLLLGHVLGDFYMQSNKMAKNKERKFKWVILHCIVYLVSMIFVSLPIISISILGIDITVSILHMLIDTAKYIYLKKCKRQYNEKKIFIIDQGIHFICLLAIAYIAVKRNIVMNELEFVNDFFYISNFSETRIAIWVLVLLFIHKPVNIFIQKFIKCYKPVEESHLFKRDNNAGRLVGTIERIVMLIFISVNQYSAIGLVLTAKSIARYDRISKDKEFAEYYLLGTLMSTVLVVICAMFL